MPNQIATDKLTEMKILAMIVRGDTHRSIAEEMNINVNTVTAIKKRNPDTIKIMREKLAEKQISSAQKILTKSRRLMESKLDQYESNEDKRLEIMRQFEDGEINHKEMTQELAKYPTGSLTELTAVSREMFNQNQVENNKPTSIPGNSSEQKQQLVDLVRAIESGDEVKLQQIIFNPKDDNVIEVQDESS
jgi:hypothetical protein